MTLIIHGQDLGGGYPQMMLDTVSEVNITELKS